MMNNGGFPKQIQQRLNALAQIRIVLVRTSHPGNVGQVARDGEYGVAGVGDYFTTFCRYVRATGSSD